VRPRFFRRPKAVRGSDRLWLIVLENDPGALEVRPSEDVGGRAVLVCQRPEESCQELADQVVARISDLEQDGRELERTLMRVVPCASDDSMNARERIARALISHSMRSPGSELLFVVRSGASVELRARMLDLTEELARGAARTSLRIRVSFGDQPAKSLFAPVADAYGHFSAREACASTFRRSS
jgi:hypothetical protein